MNATPQQVLHQIYDRIEAQPLHPVWITIVPRNQALAQLRFAPHGPLYGIPFAVKDNIDVAGMPTTAGCPAFRYIPEVTAFVVQRLLDAGAILIGKTNLDQFATGLVGTRSPHGACASVFDNRYISGGSSSGSAVAVASGLVSFALGTDTAGSGRIPAAFNNLIGLKPSRGLLSTSGVVPACRSLDCVSIFAPRCHEAHRVFQAAAQFDPGDPFSRPFAVSATSAAPFRFGVPYPHQLTFFGNTEYERLYWQAVERALSLGWQKLDFDLKPFLEAAQLLYGGPYVAERYAAVGAFVEREKTSVDPTVAAIILDSKRYTAADAYNAAYRRQALLRSTANIWKSLDALLLPTAPTTYTIEAVNNDPVHLNSHLGTYTNFVNLLDLSALAFPAGFTSSGLPFGVTLVGNTFSDIWLLQHAAAFTAEPDLSLTPTAGTVTVAVLGAHLSGQPLNSQLTQRGARLIRTVRTATDYRLFALVNSNPPKPGLVRAPGFEGPGIEAEIWDMPADHFGSFVALIPQPLGIGTCRLADGSLVQSFLCESWATEGMPDITHLGGWRAYLASRKA